MLAERFSGRGQASGPGLTGPVTGPRKRFSRPCACSGGELTDLLRACLPVLQVPEEQAVALRPRPPPLWTASDATCRIARFLPGLTEPAPLAPFLPEDRQRCSEADAALRVAVASTLVAGLELGFRHLISAFCRRRYRCVSGLWKVPARTERSDQDFRMTETQTASGADFTASERAYIRSELDMIFSTLPTVADGFQLKTWRGGCRTAASRRSPPWPRGCWSEG